MKRVLGYAEDGGGVGVEVGGGVILELDFLVGGLFFGVGIHWVVRFVVVGDFFGGFSGVEEGRVVFWGFFFVGWIRGCHYECRRLWRRVVGVSLLWI